MQKPWFSYGWCEKSTISVCCLSYQLPWYCYQTPEWQNRLKLMLIWKYTTLRVFNESRKQHNNSQPCALINIMNIYAIIKLAVILAVTFIVLAQSITFEKYCLKPGRSYFSDLFGIALMNGQYISQYIWDAIWKKTFRN